MNEIEAWDQIIVEWKRVTRMKRLNQDLYDLLGGAILFNKKYAEKNTIPFPTETIVLQLERIHQIMEQINSDKRILNPSDESLQGRKSDGDFTEPLLGTYNKTQHFYNNNT